MVAEQAPQFEIFTKRLVPMTAQPSVTIQKRGMVSVNAAAYDLMDRPDAVEFMYDFGQHIIGLRPVAVTELHAYPLRPSAGKTDGPFLISGTAFLKFFDITVDVSRRWIAQLQDGVLCVDLTAEGVPVTSNRSNAHRRNMPARLRGESVEHQVRQRSQAPHQHD